jgi:Retroviral aspartyl protease
MIRKKTLGLCFRCNEKWTQGHKCAKSIHTIEEDSEVEENGNQEEENTEEQTQEESPEEQFVTLCSFSNAGSTKTLKYKGILGSVPICVLVDTGATHSFINPVLVRELQLKTILKPTKVFRSAGGERLVTNKLCPKVVFSLQNHQFEGALRVLNVPGYDMVLGCYWLAGFGDIKLNLMK